ncbi:MAG: carboxypeptidase-like regulatory domain-containing protein, partial [Bacteroidota bacterium]
MIRITTVLLLVAVLTTSSLYAQDQGQLAGKVTNDQGEVLPGIAVMLKDTRRGAATDVQGNYTILNIAPGQHTIVVSGVGLASQEVRVTVGARQTVRQDFLMREDATQMEEVVVQTESEAETLRLSAKAVQVIETREVKLKSADLGEVLAQTEGVNVQRAGGLGSNIRFALNGLSGDQVRFFYNGIPLNFTPYSFGIANVPVNVIDRVEIYKGVVPVQFGADALGGAVNLGPPEIYDGLAGSASYQVGSFGTHRVTASVNYADEQTGLFVVVGGFFDQANNNYEIDVAIDETQEDGTPTGRLRQATVRRFHDGYQAFGANLRIGIRDKKWANKLSIEGYYGDYDNQIQNSQSPGLIDQPSLGINEAVAGTPFGDLRFTSVSQGVNLHYNVSPVEKWELDLKAGYNDNERVSIDTSRNLYNWFGEVIRLQNQPGEFGLADHLITLSQSIFARSQLSYTLSERHIFKLSVAPTYAYRTGDDLLIDGEFDPALDEGELFDLVSGLEYTLQLADDK